MKEGGLKKWFNEKWVDIGAKKKVASIRSVAENLQHLQKEVPKMRPLAKANRMTKSQKASAVARKRQVSNIGPKPTNVKTFAKG